MRNRQVWVGMVDSPSISPVYFRFDRLPGQVLRIVGTGVWRAALRARVVFRWGRSEASFSRPFLPSVQEQHLAGHYLVSEPGLAVVARPLTTLEPALRVDPHPLSHVLIAGLGELVPGRYREPFGLFTRLSTCGGVPSVSGEAE